MSFPHLCGYVTKMVGTHDEREVIGPKRLSRAP
jgi:hypothetical protein